MTTATVFHTPPRILIPKLVRSRDAWKAKAAVRKAQRKALQIRVRDLERSRLRHRQRADLLQAQVEQLQSRLTQLEAVPPTLPQTPAPQKKRPPHAVDTFPAS